MSEAMTDTTEARLQGAAAQSEDGHAGRHRGGAAAEDSAAPGHGRHRRPSEDGNTA
ncbi:hypothetical protein [Streptomyces sp. SYSU K217416]